MKPQFDLYNQVPSVGTFIRYIFVSILIFHLFGIFGVFLAFAYPLLWFFFPGKTFCFYCLHVSITKPQGYCSVCGRQVTTIYDPPTRSMLVNSMTILFLSFFAFIVVFLELTLVSNATRLNLAKLFTKEKAQFILPSKYKYGLNETFPFDVQIKNLSKPINVIQADLEFDKNLILVDKIETDQSFATIFTQKDYSNTEGWVRIVGGIPNPGYVGETGLFSRIVFKPVKTGACQITFLSSSKILANDGKGTNISANFPSQSIIITNEDVMGIKDESRNWLLVTGDWLWKLVTGK